MAIVLSYSSKKFLLKLGVGPLISFFQTYTQFRGSYGSDGWPVVYKPHVCGLTPNFPDSLPHVKVFHDKTLNPESLTACSRECRRGLIKYQLLTFCNMSLFQCLDSLYS